MADVAASAAVCIGTGVIVTPFCAAFGFDPTLLIGGVVGGFVGTVIAQTLIPDKTGRTYKRMLALMVGSVLLAGIATLLVAPWVIRQLDLSDVPPGAVRLAIGAAIGSVAQPLAVLWQTKLMVWLGNLGSKKENGNA